MRPLSHLRAHAPFAVGLLACCSMSAPSCMHDHAMSTRLAPPAAASSRVSAVEESLLVEGATRTFSVLDHRKDRDRDGVLVFLHGLDAATVSDQARGHYALFRAAAERLHVMAVFPRGSRGTLANQPELLGWYPEGIPANRAFFASLVDHLVAHHGVDRRRIVLVGFSSGAFFAARELQESALPIGGYYLIAGGEPSASPFACAAPKPSVVVEVGRDDEFQYAKAMALVERLEGCASLRLRVIRHERGHELIGLGLDENLRFLLEPQSPPL